MPPVYYPLEYTPEALENLFGFVADRPWSMLLHSGFAEHSDNRFDIMVAEPQTTLITRGKITSIQQGDTLEISEEDPLTLLDRVLAQCGLQAAEDDDFPF